MGELQRTGLPTLALVYRPQPLSPLATGIRVTCPAVRMQMLRSTFLLRLVYSHIVLQFLVLVTIAVSFAFASNECILVWFGNAFQHDLFSLEEGGGRVCMLRFLAVAAN